MPESHESDRNHFAHSLPGRPIPEWEPLEDHLGRVAERAARFAEPFGASELARLAGRWHDLGKYRWAFQEYLRRTGTTAEEEGERSGPTVDHSTAGAIHSVRAIPKPAGRLLAYLIAGHHAGLPDAVGEASSLLRRLERSDLLEDALRAEPPAEFLAPPDRIDERPPSSDPRRIHLWIRMIFSALVDADFLETEAVLDPERSSRRPGWRSLDELEEALIRYLEVKVRGASGPMAEPRSKVLESCRAAASLPPGAFSLTVPTGGGKTLSSMAFALGHAHANGLRRIIYVIPYTSIIEQTADVFREVFGPDSIVEHHSNLAPDRDDERSRIAAENWDAPVIVTTNVQFFESLFASRTSRCRKLHNIARSVIVLDEVQLLPPEFLDPIRQALDSLVRDFGSTVVLSTATQPSLLPGAREIVAIPEDLSRELRRVRVEWPSSPETDSWEALADRIRSHERVLCIVNRRDDARALASLMPPDTIHLSALMCGEHRSRVIRRIREALAGAGSVRVVSTQLVEAGVDIDFPVVFRAMGGLDSIAQAGGRCNREWRLPKGRLIVFHPPRRSPIGMLRKAEDTTRELLEVSPEIDLSPGTFQRYFDLFFRKVNSLDREGILRLLEPGDPRSPEIQFRTAAQRFRLVDDSSYRAVVVTWGEGEKLVRRLRREGPSRGLLRRLQRFTVNLPERQLRPLLASGDIVELDSEILVQQRSRLYDERFGLLTESPEFAAEETVV